jgi:hypothetical protein
LQYIFLAGSFLAIAVFCLSSVVSDLSLVALGLSLLVAPVLGLPWVVESVVLGAEEAMKVGVVIATVVVFTIATVLLIAWVTGVELAVCTTGGSTAMQPAAAGLEAHREAGGSTAPQPATVGVEIHCASVGSMAVQPAAVGVEVHWASVGSTTLQPAVVGAEVH